jgi:hypothetical protein
VASAKLTGKAAGVVSRDELDRVPEPKPQIDIYPVGFEERCDVSPRRVTGSELHFDKIYTA